MATPEQIYLESRKEARGNQESANDQPDNTEAVDVSQDAPVEEVIESEVITNEEVATETEEPAEAETEQATDDDESEDLYVEYQGREINLKDVYKKEQEQMMQADYTRKTQGHAEDVKTFNADKEEFNAKQITFNEKMAQVDAILKDETLTAEQLEEMWEYEPEKVKAYQERQVRLKALVGEAVTVNPTKSVDMVKVSADLFAAHPEWIVDGKQSKQFTDDTNLMTAYADSRGIGQAELSSFEAKHYEVMLDAARYKSLNNKNAAIEKKVRKAPVSTKPRAKANNSVQSEIAIVQKRFNQTGNDKDFLLLRRLQRQLK